MYTMKQAAEKMNLSVHTLRFYANEGLFPDITRDYNNNRQFSEKDLEWIKIVQCLRDTDMPVTEVKRYIALCKKGDGTIEERFHMLTAQKEKAEAELKEMKKRISLLGWKLNYYENCLKNNNSDICNPSNDSKKVMLERRNKSIINGKKRMRYA
jgi:MerR family transcriptional regulator, aldehyde-responsive regulator